MIFHRMNERKMKCSVFITRAHKSARLHGYTCASCALPFLPRKSFSIISIFFLFLDFCHCLLLCGTGTGRNYLLDDDIKKIFTNSNSISNGEYALTLENAAFKTKKNLK